MRTDVDNFVATYQPPTSAAGYGGNVTTAGSGGTVTAAGYGGSVTAPAPVPQPNQSGLGDRENNRRDSNNLSDRENNRRDSNDLSDRNNNGNGSPSLMDKCKNLVSGLLNPAPQPPTTTTAAAGYGGAIPTPPAPPAPIPNLGSSMGGNTCVHYNQGIGNGAEGGDPGKSQPRGGSNDETGRTPGQRPIK